MVRRLKEFALESIKKFLNIQSPAIECAHIQSDLVLRYGYWMDSNGNGWSKDMYTKKQAEQYSYTLVNCTGCIDCFDCENCEDCEGCEDCVNCYGCIYCTDCEYCMNVIRCKGGLCMDRG